MTSPSTVTVPAVPANTAVAPFFHVVSWPPASSQFASVAFHVPEPPFHLSVCPAIVPFSTLPANDPSFAVSVSEPPVAGEVSSWDKALCEQRFQQLGSQAIVVL